MSKAVEIKMPPAKTQSADKWVGEGLEPHLRSVETLPTAPVRTKRTWKRLTLEIPLDLHARVKLACVERGKTMLEEIVRLLEAEFPASA